MHAITSAPGAARLLAISIVARIPLAMLSIALLVHAEQLTGSFAAAGIVAGAYAVSLGIGGPLLGQLVDRRGQTSVLVVSAVASTAFLAAIALLPAGAPLLVLVALATAIGLSSPPIGSCLRAQAIRTVFVVLLAVGVVFGAVEVGVAAAAAALGSMGAAGPLLGIWGAGSLVGGMLAVRLGRGAGGAAGLAAVLALLTAGHLALIAAAGSVFALAAVLVVAGA